MPPADNWPIRVKSEECSQVNELGYVVKSVASECPQLNMW